LLLQKWHLDVCLFLLLLASFSAANALALIYIAMVAAGMALPSRTQQVTGQQGSTADQLPCMVGIGGATLAMYIAFRAVLCCAVLCCVDAHSLPGARMQRTWQWLVVPLLALLAIEQYTGVWVGNASFSCCGLGGL